MKLSRVSPQGAQTRRRLSTQLQRLAQGTVRQSLPTHDTKVSTHQHTTSALPPTNTMEVFMRGAESWRSRNNPEKITGSLWLACRGPRGLGFVEIGQRKGWVRSMHPNWGSRIFPLCREAHGPPHLTTLFVLAAHQRVQQTSWWLAACLADRQADPLRGALWLGLWHAKGMGRRGRGPMPQSSQL